MTAFRADRSTRAPHIFHKAAANGTFVESRFVPRDIIAIWVTGTAIECVSFFAFALYDFATILCTAFRTGNTNLFLHRLDIMTFWKSRAAYEIAKSAMLFDERLSAYRTHFSCHFRGRRR